MKRDPLETYSTSTIHWPPSQGPGSGKEAWRAFAEGRVEQCEILNRVIDEQSDTIRALNAEIALLRRQIETRKPKGGRPRTPDAKAQAIEAELSQGYSKRSIAKRHRVSATTVVRIAKRMQERDGVV
jgi:hypothetical protein